MEIKIGDPYIVGHNLSLKETKQIAKVLGNSMQFKLAIKNLREKYGIPATGFNLKDKKERQKARLFDVFNPNFIDDVFELTQLFKPHLPRYWTFSLLYFVLEDILRPPQAPEIFCYPSKNVAFRNKKNPFGLYLLLGYKFILIGENISKKQLHDYIDEQWNDDLKEDIQKLPKNPINKMSRLELGEKIIVMKDIEDLTFPEIANKLSKEVTNIDEYEKLNTENIKTIYHRTKKKLKITGKVKP